MTSLVVHFCSAPLVCLSLLSTPLTAAHFSDLDAAREVLEGLREEASGEDSRWLESLEPTGFAAREIEIMEVLLEYGADASIRDYYGHSALHEYFLTFYGRALIDQAGAKPSPELVRLLLEHGNGVEQVREDESDGGYRMMFYALRGGADAETIKLLFEHSVEVDRVAGGGRTWFHHVARYGADLEVYQVLLDVGVDPSVVNEDGATACNLFVEHSESRTKQAEDVRELLFR